MRNTLSLMKNTWISWCMDRLDDSMSILGPLLVTLAVLLIGGCAIIAFTILLPWHEPGENSPFFALVVYAAQWVLAVWLALLILFNYYHAVTIHAGRPDFPPSAGTRSRAEAEIRLQLESTSQLVSSDTTPTQLCCQKCLRMKPERAHHCSLCRCCILKFDHHCPWIHGCVGHHNYRYFILFQFYLWLGCLYFAVLSIGPIHEHFFSDNTIRPVLDSSALSGAGGGGGDAEESQKTILFQLVLGTFFKQALVFGLLLSVAMVFALGGLMGWQGYLVLTNQTTVEYYQNKYKKVASSFTGESALNPYDLGTSRNLALFFNICDDPFWYVLLPVRVPAYGDGYHFKTYRSLQINSLKDR